MSEGRESDGFAHHVWTAEEWGWRASDAGPPGRDGDLARDLVGIDLDSRNAELARQRVGMFLEIDVPETERTA